MLSKPRLGPCLYWVYCLIKWKNPEKSSNLNGSQLFIGQVKWIVLCAMLCKYLGRKPQGSFTVSGVGLGWGPGSEVVMAPWVSPVGVSPLCHWESWLGRRSSEGASRGWNYGENLKEGGPPLCVGAGFFCFVFLSRHFLFFIQFMTKCIQPLLCCRHYASYWGFSGIYALDVHTQLRSLWFGCLQL